MFPNHCKEVSIKKVSFTLNNDEINKNLMDKLAYKRTNYILLNNKDQWAVVKMG
ncbi:MAG: hypothetical protein JSV09_03855 [Thermoplasmata archaeon]|nr:MAG: hypothetical protein JSV09_03855 [Thermoplasmata archaeon]